MAAKGRGVMPMRTHHWVTAAQLQERLSRLRVRVRGGGSSMPLLGVVGRVRVPIPHLGELESWDLLTALVGLGVGEIKD